MINAFEPYDLKESLFRISNILNANKKTNTGSGIPSEYAMSMLSQYKGECTVMAINIDFTPSYKENDEFENMKVFESYVSEIATILRGCGLCKDFSIVNDTFVSIFETPLKIDIERVVDNMARIISLRKIIIKKANIPNKNLKVKVGIDFGQCEAYYIGTQRNPQPSILWRGKTVSNTMKLLTKDTEDNSAGLITSVIYNNLSDDYKKLFDKDILDDKVIYSSHAVNTEMNDWINKH